MPSSVFQGILGGLGEAYQKHNENILSMEIDRRKALTAYLQSEAHNPMRTPESQQELQQHLMPLLSTPYEKKLPKDLESGILKSLASAPPQIGGSWMGGQTSNEIPVQGAAVPTTLEGSTGPTTAPTIPPSVSMSAPVPAPPEGYRAPALMSQSQIGDIQAKAAGKKMAAEKTAEMPFELAKIQAMNASKPEAKTFNPEQGLFDPITGKTIREPGKKPVPAPKVNYSNDGIPVSITHGDNEYTVGDPNMPAELKPLEKVALDAHDKRRKEVAYAADQANKNIEARAEEASIRTEKRAEQASARQAVLDEKRAAIKDTQAPEAIKTKVDSAYTTKDMIDTVRNLVKKKPYLIGPAAGRLEEGFQGVGTSFGMQKPEDEEDAATLNGHLVYLFVNELRATSPGGRTNQELIKLLKERSAKITQNPNILSGFLKSAENNSNIVIKDGKRWGIDLDKQAPTPPSSTGSSPKTVKDPLGIR